MKLAIVMPAYNEEKRIGGTLEAYSNHFESLKKAKKLDYSIIVVINNTKDRTEEIVKKLRKSNKNLFYINLKRGGKGYAIKEGFREALKDKNHDLIGFVDADMSTRPEEYARLVSRLGKADGVIASRYMKGSIVRPKPTLKRIIASRVYNLLIKVLFSTRCVDTQCGAKIFKREVIAKVLPNLVQTKWAVDVDILFNAKRAGFRIKEVPTRWSDSDYSKINFMRAGPFMALAMIRLRLLNSPFSQIVRFYDKMPKWMKIHNRFR